MNRRQLFMGLAAAAMTPALPAFGHVLPANAIEGFWKVRNDVTAPFRQGLPGPTLAEVKSAIERHLAGEGVRFPVTFRGWRTPRYARRRLWMDTTFYGLEERVSDDAGTRTLEVVWSSPHYKDGEIHRDFVSLEYPQPQQETHG